MNERRTLNWFVCLLVISIIGACNVKPANTTTTTFVVWDPKILATVGIVPRVTAADLVNQEGVPTMSASEIAAFEANPALQSLPPTYPARGERDWDWGVELAGEGWRMFSKGVPDPNSTRTKPTTRPAPPKY